MAELVPQMSILVQDLAGWSNEDIRARALAVFPQLALWALRDARDTGQLLDNFAHWGAAFTEAASSQAGMLALAHLVRYVSVVTNDLHYAQFRAKIREIAPAAEPAIMTIAEELRQEGRKEGQKEMLLHLLREKFVELRDDEVARVETADDAMLDQYAKRILTADSVAAVLGA